MEAKNLRHQMASLAAVDSDSSSASVLEVVTVRCLAARQSIGPLYSWKRYPSELLRVSTSSAKAASLEQRKISPWSHPEYSMARLRVKYR